MLNISHLSKFYGDKKAVDDLSLNTLGGIFGYFIFKLVNSIRKRF